jgi:hypothetical protein
MQDDPVKHTHGQSSCITDSIHKEESCECLIKNLINSDIFGNHLEAAPFIYDKHVVLAFSSNSSFLLPDAVYIASPVHVGERCLLNARDGNDLH